MVIREAEWDDHERNKMLALAEYEAGVCSGCGFHHSFTEHDPWVTIEDRTCPTCRTIAPQIRVFADADAKDAERLREAPKARGARDGKTRVLRPLSPLEALEAQQRAKPQ